MKKTSGDIIILEKCTKNQDHMLYCSMTDVIVVFHFGLFLPFYHRNSQKNQDLKKSEKKKAWGYHHFTNVYQKLWLDDVQFLKNGAQQTDGWKEKVTHRGGCPT